MKLAIGSANPTKISAVKNVLERLGLEYEIVVAKVDSGIEVQPASDEETIRGAFHRATSAIEKADSDFGVGLEGGVHDTVYGMFLTNWAAVVDKDGNYGIGSSVKILLPDCIAEKIRYGHELGDAIGEFVGDYNIRSKQGTLGVLTNNLITRTSSSEGALVCAFARFVNSQLYE